MRGCARPTGCPAWSSPTTRSRCRSTTPTPAGEQHHRVRPRGGRPAQARPGPALAAVPAGRPGCAAPPGRSNRSGWLGRALTDHRVLLLDQRGTGRSTPADPADARRPAATPPQQARYLTPLPGRRDRAGRRAGPAARCSATTRRWTVLGQSYGGFVAPDLPLARAGGAASRSSSPAACRRWTAARTTSTARPTRGSGSATTGCVDRYPGDAARLDAIADHVAAHRRTAALAATGSPCRGCSRSGIGLGCSRRAGAGCTTCSSRPGPAPSCADDFLAGVEAATSFVDRPLYALLHESIYCQGAASRWSAQRVARQSCRSSRRTRARCCRPARWCSPALVHGDRALAPLAEAAELLAAYDDWPPLYDRDGSPTTRCRSQRWSTTTTCTSSTPTRWRRRSGSAPALLGHQRARPRRAAQRRPCLDRLLDMAARRRAESGSPRREDHAVSSTVAFVLGGGGLLGAGEVGMLQALLEAGIRARRRRGHVGRRHQRGRRRRRPHPRRGRRRCAMSGSGWPAAACTPAVPLRAGAATSPGPAPTCTPTSRCAPCSTSTSATG